MTTESKCRLFLAAQLSVGLHSTRRQKRYAGSLKPLPGTNPGAEPEFAPGGPLLVSFGTAGNTSLCIQSEMTSVLFFKFVLILFSTSIQQAPSQPRAFHVSPTFIFFFFLFLEVSHYEQRQRQSKDNDKNAKSTSCHVAGDRSQSV